MSKESGIGEQIKDPNRRKFLMRTGKLAVAAVGAAALGGIVSNEVSKSENGIVTESGTFFPLYEWHDEGIKVESIPEGLDVFFREILGGDIFAPNVLRLRYRLTYFNSYNPAFPDKILAFLSQAKTEIMLGDVKTPGVPKIDKMILSGEVVAGGGLILGLSTLRSKVSLEAGIGRRKFLQAVMLAGVVWSLSKASGVPGIFLEPSNENAIDRVYSRLVAIESHMHPELSIVFLRDIMMADKLLTVSEDIEKRTGQKAKIAFQVGAAHAGIEDFLQAGHDFCRGLILAYPKWYLRSTVELNNGIRDFSSARLLSLPENLRAEDVASREKLSLTTERRVVDEKLEKALRLKLT